MRRLIPAIPLLLAILFVPSAATSDLLERLGLDRPASTEPLYLVQTRAETPLPAGLVVHDRRGDLAVVSGDARLLDRLARSGARLLLLEEVPRTLPTRPQRAVVPAEPDPRVQALVDQVEWFPLRDKIQWLVDFGTRYSYMPQCRAAAESLCVFFDGLGLSATLQDFYFDTGYLGRNVMAIQPGTTHPDSIYVICAHYDSISDHADVDAPGADDNGSGTAAVMTAAQILASHRFDCSIYYLCFAAEEQGLIGSRKWVNWAVAEGLNVAGALNFDMIGFWRPSLEFDLEIETNGASQWLGAIVTAAADLYTGMPYELHVYDDAWWGDHYRFWEAGIPAINHEEAWDWGDPDFNPDYHTTRDLLKNIRADFAVGNTKVAIAALATLATPSDPVAVTPVGRPSLQLTLLPNPSSGASLLRLRAPAGVRLAEGAIYDLRGRRVASFELAVTDGEGRWRWDGRDDEGRELPSGSYLCRMRAGGEEVVAKILHLR